MDPLIIYHRGRHGPISDGTRLEENTLPAFEQAIKEGAQMIEFDVWTGLRVAHDPGRISVPTLSEVLDLVDGRCGVNVEIKSPQAAPDALKKIEDVLATGRWTPEQIVLSAFHHETALLCKKELPDLRVGVINDGVLLTPYIEMLREQGIDNLHLDWANIYMDIEAGNRMRNVVQKHGMQIWVWTVNSVDVFKTVSAYGANAIFTDRPDLMRNQLRI